MAAKKVAKAKKKLTKKEQSERFKKAARDLEAAGELNLTDAEEKFEGAIKRVANRKGRP